MLSKQQQEYLCDGYIKNHYAYSVPIAINRLIQNFWNEYIHWSFKGNNLQNFLNAKSGDTFYNRYKKSFKIKNIKFTPQLFPNGRHGKFDGNILYRMNMDLSANIDTAVIYYELHCIQTDIHWRSIKRAEGISNEIRGAGNWKLSLKLLQCINKKQLDFIYFVDILEIKYKDKSKPIYNKSITTYKQTHFEWTINKLKLQSFLNYNRYQHYFSNKFGNNCFGLYCLPKGYNENINKFVYGFDLCALPNGISKMEIKFHLYAEPNIYYKTKTKIISYENGYNSYMEIWTDQTIEDIVSKISNCISINCELEIIRAWNQKLDEIPSDKLYKYGIK